eukprot:10956616-Heterocapsa_arctica.AAC.1
MWIVAKQLLAIWPHRPQRRQAPLIRWFGAEVLDLPLPLPLPLPGGGVIVVEDDEGLLGQVVPGCHGA